MHARHLISDLIIKYEWRSINASDITRIDERVAGWCIAAKAAHRATALRLAVSLHVHPLQNYRMQQQDICEVYVLKLQTRIIQEPSSDPVAVFSRRNLYVLRCKQIIACIALLLLPLHCTRPAFAGKCSLSIFYSRASDTLPH